MKGLENRTRKIWTRSIITRILNNEVYIGNCCRGKSQKISYKTKKRIYLKRNQLIITKKTHEAIISEELYNKIHDNNKYGNIKEERNEYKTVLYKYMYCGCCKDKMLRRKSRNYINVHCTYRNETDIKCTNNKLYIYEQLEKAILDNISQRFNKYFKENNVSPSLIKKYNNMKIKAFQKELNNINKELSIITFKISKLYNDRLLENINEDEYKSAYLKLVEERKIKTSEVNKLTNTIEELDTSCDEINEYKRIKNALKRLKKDTLTEEDIGQLIDKIEIYDNEIHIFYKFRNMESQKISCFFCTL